MRRTATVLMSAILSFASNALATLTAYPFEIENRRTYTVAVEVDHFSTEAQARASARSTDMRSRDRAQRVRLRAGEKVRLPTSGWVRWCQVVPPSSLPCELVDVRPNGSSVTLE
jgi:hypothetical protein